MRLILIYFFLLLPGLIWSQVKYEITEFSGTVSAIDPGYSFALERLTLDVDGKPESFLFYPEYGELISKKIKVGDKITLRANVNKEIRKQMEEVSQVVTTVPKAQIKKLEEMKPFLKFARWLFRDHITEIKIENEWLRLDKPIEGEKDKDERERLKYNAFEGWRLDVFLEKKIRAVYSTNDVKCGLIFEDAKAAYTDMLYTRSIAVKSAEPGGVISFVGRKLPKKNGYQYPVPDVKEAYSLSPLRKEIGVLHSFLFKQNHACIGVKFKTSNEHDLSVSFPSERAMEVKAFLKPDKDLTIYYGEYSDLERNNLPELHALIQEQDTLFIKEFGFYGSPDSKHDHRDTEFEGKITRIDKTKKGNIMSLIVAPSFYVEIDALLAQQLGRMFEKGKQVKIVGKERVKKIGEIYSKDYRIVTPLKIVIDGKTFSAYQP